MKADKYTSVPQPKSNPAILTPANLTPATTVRAALKTTIEPAISFEMECMAENEIKIERQVTNVVVRPSDSQTVCKSKECGGRCGKD